MALIAIASDKGAPGVTTAALALAAVWPRPVLLAECDPAGGDLVYRFPAAGGGHLDPRRGVLSLAVIARRGMAPHQVWEHTQKLHGGLDVLAGVTNAEQGAGLSLLWGPIGKVLASLPQADVIADCGRLGADGPLYDLLAEATAVVLVSKVQVADVIRLRDRATAFAAAARSRGRRGFGVGVVVVADHKKLRASLGEVQQVLGQANAPATVLGGIAHDIKGADLLNGQWGGNLDRTLLIKTAREVVQHLVQGLPPIGSPATSGPPAVSPQAVPSAAAPSPVPAASSFPVPASAGPSTAAPSYAGSVPATSSYAGSVPATSSYAGSVPATTSYARSGSAAPTYAGPVNTAPSYALPEPNEAQPAAPSSLTGPQAGPGSPQVSETAAEASRRAGTPAAGSSTAGVPTARGGSPAGPRTAFSRVLGARSGRHQADPGQNERTSGPAASASFPPAAPDEAADPAQAQVSYVSAPVTGAQATGSGAGRPAARHAQGAARPADDGPGYSRTPMNPLEPGNSGAPSSASSALAGPGPAGPAPVSPALAGPAPVSPAPAAGFPDRPLPDPLFADSRFQDSQFQDSRFPAVDFHTSPLAGSKPPEPNEADPTAGPADRPDQDDSGWENSRWDTSPGPMGSRRPGRG
jgi:MinD-like ATPase involved in chromosome partitioning or flagellar assembly